MCTHLIIVAVFVVVQLTEPLAKCFWEDVTKRGFSMHQHKTKELKLFVDAFNNSDDSRDLFEFVRLFLLAPFL